LPGGPLRNDAQSPIHVTVTNRGSTTRTGVRAELYFPPGLSSIFLSQFSDDGRCDGGVGAGNTCSGGETAFWDVGDLPPGRGKTLTMVAPTRSDNPNGRLLPFFARAFAQGTSEFWERRALAIDDGRALNLEIDPVSNVVPTDSAVEYEITVANQGQTGAANTTLQLPVPAGTSVLSADGNSDVLPDSVVWNIGPFGPGQGTRRHLTLSLDAPLAPGDILELQNAELSADGMPVTRNGTMVRAKNNRDLDQLLSLMPQTALPGDTISAATTITNESGFLVIDVTAETAFLNDKQFWDIGDMNPGTTQQRLWDLSLATGDGAFELGTLVNFSSRMSSASTDGDFQTRTLIVGDQIPPPGPDIVVTGNDILIANGDSSPSVADGTDFGTVNIAGGIGSRSFAILNSGTIDLEIASVTITGSDPSAFEVVTQPTAVVPAGTQTTFVMEFDPDSSGPKEATVAVDSNDEDDDPYTFAIAGQGIDAGDDLIFIDRFETQPGP